VPQVLDPNGYLIEGSWFGFGVGQSVAYTGTAGTILQPVNSAYATGIVTSDNTIPTDGDTITIGNKIYTFKTALTPTEGQVLINASAVAAVTNLIRAINHTGTPNTDYSCAAAHTQVQATVNTTLITNIIALVSGVAGNAIAMSDTASTRFTEDATLTNGAEDRGSRYVRVMLSTAGFIKIANAPTAVITDYAMAAGIPGIFFCRKDDKVSAIQSTANGTLSALELF